MKTTPKPLLEYENFGGDAARPQSINGRRSLAIAIAIICFEGIFWVLVASHIMPNLGGPYYYCLGAIDFVFAGASIVGVVLALMGCRENAKGPGLAVLATILHLLLLIMNLLSCAIILLGVGDNEI